MKGLIHHPAEKAQDEVQGGDGEHATGHLSKGRSIHFRTIHRNNGLETDALP